jgi:hypothetical protein
MEKLALTRVSTARKQADRKEDDFRYAMTGICTHKHDSVEFSKGADVLDYSIKTSHASLPSTLKGETIADKLNDMYKRDYANKYVYISDNNDAYIMDKREFTAFVTEFGRLERDSQKNGGGMKVRLLRESSRMLAWLNA